MNQTQKFEAPEITVVTVKEEDIIRTSNEWDIVPVPQQTQEGE